MHRTPGSTSLRPLTTSSQPCSNILARYAHLKYSTVCARVPKRPLRATTWSTPSALRSLLSRKPSFWLSPSHPEEAFCMPTKHILPESRHNQREHGRSFFPGGISLDHPVTVFAALE